MSIVSKYIGNIVYTLRLGNRAANMLKKSSFLNKRRKYEITVELVDLATSVGGDLSSVELVVGNQPEHRVGNQPEHRSSARFLLKMEGDKLVVKEASSLKFRTGLYQTGLDFRSKEQRIDVVLNHDSDAFFCIPLDQVASSGSMEFTADLMTNTGIIKSAAVHLRASCRVSATTELLEVQGLLGLGLGVDTVPNIDSDSEDEFGQSFDTEWTSLGKQKASFILKETGESDSEDDYIDRQSMDKEW